MIPSDIWNLENYSRQQQSSQGNIMGKLAHTFGLGEDRGKSRKGGLGRIQRAGAHDLQTQDAKSDAQLCMGTHIPGPGGFQQHTWWASHQNVSLHYHSEFCQRSSSTTASQALVPQEKF